MAKSLIFVVAAIWHPNEEEQKQGQKSKFIIEPKYVLGADEKTVGMKTVMEIPAEEKEKIDQIEIAIRPF